jgi:gliding motility-associated-like protein
LKEKGVFRIKILKLLLLRTKVNHILSKLIVLFVFIYPATASSIFGQTPVANFSASTTSGCAPLTVSFTDQSTGNPTSWNWQFGNGQLSTIKNPVVTFSQPGTYTIKLVVRNADGIDEEEKIDYITVFPSPSASFSADLTTACVPATIQFTDQSTTPPGITITQWQWTFGDGGVSTAQNPAHTYSANGFYTVTLKITSSTGCTSTAVIGNYIRIVSGITTNFTFSPPSTCGAPFVVTFQDQSSGPGTLSYTWDFGNGTPTSNLPNPTTVYPTIGNYTVQLNVKSNLGCTGSLQKIITVAGTTTNFTAPASVCIGQAVNFQNNSSSLPVASTWDFGDGTTSGQINPTKAFLSAGTYQVKLINQYANCSDSITKSITVIDKPVVDFTVNDTTSCSAPFTVQFTDLTAGATGWLWDFGDGTTSTLQNPSHQYNSFGDYTVTLTATSGAGCSNTIIKTNYIKIRKTQVTIVNAPDGGCVPFTYSPLVNIQTVDNIVSYAWDLGEPGATYNVQFPTHTYNSAGNYDIKLTVTTQSGCIETITIPKGVRTGVRPIVNFSYNPSTPICASATINFTDLSTTTAGAQVQWFWDFGDGNISTSQNPSHIFKDTGAIIVTLIVSNNGCLDSAKQTLQILPPVANFGYKLDCNKRLQVIFSDSSLTNPVYGPITYEWKMGDPANTIIMGAAPPTFIYPAYGTYNVTLIVTNGPCSYQVVKPVNVSNEKADFTINKNPVCKNEMFILTAVNSDPTLIISYTWTIGSDPPLIDTTRSITYSLAGNGAYDVTLTMVDIYGCTITKTVPGFISVIGPVANFVPAMPGGCANKPTVFNDLSAPAGNIIKWSWDFGDGTQQVFTAPPFTHIYTQPGSYSVSLTITDLTGCTDTYNNSPVNLLVTDSHVGFRADTVYCPSALLQFTDTSSGPGLTYQWSFGDGATSTLQNPQHAYPMGDNNYTIKLKITDIAGCEDSTTKTNYINIRSPKAAFDLHDTASICPPLVARFTFRGKDYKSFSWNFGDGSTSTLQDPIYFYNQYGNFIPKLYLIGNGGCIDSAQATVNVYNPNTSAQILFSPASGCNSLTVNFNLTSPPGFKFKFYYGDGTFDTTQQKTLSHFYASPGNYYPYMLIADTTGCVVGVSGPGPVNVFGAIPLFGKDKKEFCDQGEVLFSNYTLSNDPVISSVWDFGDGSTSTASDPSHIFNAPGTYIVKLNVVTQNQCASSFADTVRVYRTPVTSITSRDTLCLNMAEPFRGVLAQADTAISWQWNFGNGSASQQQNANVTYTATANYVVQLTAVNKIGCSGAASKNVYVVPSPTVTAVTDPVIVPSGSGANLNMTYTGNIISYLWSPSINLDCTDCPIPFANPRTTTKYTVQVQDKYSCINKGDITIRVVCDDKNFFIPNTFSPNGDGSNDIFYPRGKGLFRIKSLRVFNRWGEVVFEKREFQANDPSSGWNGTYKGQKPVPDVYVYQVEIYCNNDQLIQLAGNVALIL